VLASHNAGKLREIAELLEPMGIEVVSAGDLGLDEPEGAHASDGSVCVYALPGLAGWA